MATSWTGLLQNNGFDVRILDAFDYAAFAEEGAGYLKRSFSAEVANEQIKNSYIPQEIEFTRQLLNSTAKFDTKPSLEKVQELIADGYLVICNVNAQILNNEDGYVGHFVVVYKIDDKQVYFHDPGPPAIANRTEKIAKFEQAWAVTHDAYACKLTQNPIDITN